LMILHREHLDTAALEQTLGCVLKVHEDRGVVNAHHASLDPILGDVSAGLEAGGYSLDTDFGIGSVSAPRDQRRIVPHSDIPLSAWNRSGA
ncbi:hypothetical protein, partial [Halalkalibacter lacteus]|uniref:hypothetical protein n=1 Tax=Halalkalibacter lacteus TaxID=3090663 RepID=UPI002FCAC890